MKRNKRTRKKRRRKKNVEQTEKDLKKIFPESEWEKRHLQIILFGRTYCKALGHMPEKCPICSVVGCKVTKS